MNQLKLTAKTLRVINSCTTHTQLMAASNYLELAKRHIISPARREMLHRELIDKFRVTKFPFEEERVDG